MHLHIAEIESTDAESAISLFIGRFSKAKKWKHGGRTRREHQQLLKVFMELQRQQGVILTKLGTEICEED